MTAEFALVLPAVVALLVLALALGAAAITQIRCADAARAAARAAAIGEAPETVAAIARELAGDRAQVSVTREGDRVVVEVSRPVGAGALDLGTVTGRAVAVLEPGVAHAHVQEPSDTYASRALHDAQEAAAAMPAWLVALIGSGVARNARRSPVHEPSVRDASVRDVAERGSGTVLGVAIVAAVLAGVVAAASLTGVVRARGEAQTAADLAAVAAATRIQVAPGDVDSACGTAERVAAHHGTVLTSCAARGGGVIVVEVSAAVAFPAGLHAGARATAGPA